MAKDEMFDPFGGLYDVPELTPAEHRTALLQKSRRGYVPIRKILVQKQRTAPERAAKLAELVRGRHHRPLEALLLVHALEPVLRDDPLDTRTWARLLSARDQCTPNAASKAFGTLVELGLVDREKDGRRTVVRPRHESGDDRPWYRPGSDEDDEIGVGYFTLPHAYWTAGLADKLTLPGKAMLLIILAETTQLKKATFAMPVEKAPTWYGISERTAERGYRELLDTGLTDVRVIKVPDPRHPVGRRDVHHRSLLGSFGTMDRRRLQGKAKTAVKARAEKAELGVAGGPE